MFQQIKVHFNPSIRNIDSQNKFYEVIPVSPTRSRKVELIESLAKSPKTSKIIAKKVLF